MLTIEDLHTQNLLLLEAVSGSRAYGLATTESDTDIKGVFYLPKSMFYGMEYIPQISNETNDIVYYELGGLSSFCCKAIRTRWSCSPRRPTACATVRR